MAISLLTPLSQIPFAFVDVETSGASAQWGERVIEVGVARVEGGVIIQQYESLIDPQKRIAAGVTALTGISQAMVAGKPTFAQALADVTTIMRGAIVVGHNIRFDLSFLEKEYRRLGHDFSTAWDTPHVMDTVRIARKMFGRGGNGLQRLCRRLGYQPPVAHRALADVITTFEVFERMLTPLGGWNLTLADALMLQGGTMALTQATPGESVLPLELEEALDQRKPVMMEYMDASKLVTQRVVQPLEIRRFKGELVLIAHCQLRNERRNFKVERIVRLERVEVTGP